jgi:hypothetical protein
MYLTVMKILKEISFLYKIVGLPDIETKSIVKMSTGAE